MTRYAVLWTEHDYGRDFTRHFVLASREDAVRYANGLAGKYKDIMLCKVEAFLTSSPIWHKEE